MPLFLQVGPYGEPEATFLGLNSEMLWFAVGAALLVAIGMLAMVQFLRAFLFIARPSEALIFSGGANRAEDGSSLGYAIIKSGLRRTRTPILETVSRLDMTVLPIDVVVQNAYSRGNIPLEIHAIANVKIHHTRWSAS
jgi:flotillin